MPKQLMTIFLQTGLPGESAVYHAEGECKLELDNVRELIQLVKLQNLNHVGNKTVRKAECFTMINNLCRGLMQALLLMLSKLDD